MKINTHTSHPSVFISSTFIDLKAERKAVAAVLKDSGVIVNALDVKPASNDSSKREIQNGIKESDFIIVIVGERYGSIIHDMTGSNKLSITRWEYIRAVKLYKKDALVYFKVIESDDPLFFDDQNSQYHLKRRYLKEFKDILTKNHNPKYFSSADDLANEIKSALIPTYRSGVKRLLMKIETQRLEIDRLNKEIQDKNQLINKAEVSAKDIIPNGQGIAPRTNLMDRGLTAGPPNVLARGIETASPRNLLSGYGIAQRKPSSEKDTDSDSYGLLGLRPSNKKTGLLGLAGARFSEDDETEK